MRKTPEICYYASIWVSMTLMFDSLFYDQSKPDTANAAMLLGVIVGSSLTAMLFAALNWSDSEDEAGEQ